jgi:ABC-type lipoprotein export system ATPase subunit
VILSSEHLCKSYGERAVLRNCSLAVKAGECVLLRGPSGGGKSTLLRILALLETADSGRVTHGESIWEMRQLPGLPAYPFLTLVFQQLFLWPNLTMGENLSLVLAHQPNLPPTRAATDLLGRFAIHQLLERHPHECSLGERQRLAIARALLSKAQFLLLDEPSSALDRANQGILLQELKAAKANDRGVLLITHDDRGFDAIADQSFELENGELRRR